MKYIKVKLIPTAIIFSIFFFLFSSSVLGQSFNCDLIQWDYVKDTTLSTGELAIEISLSTTENTLNSGYTDYWITNGNNDTLAKFILSTGWMPAIEPFGTPCIKSIFLLIPPFETIESQSNLKLTTRNPNCVFELSNTTNVNNIVTEKQDFQIYPNPTQNRLTINSDENYKIEQISISESSGKFLFYSKNVTHIDLSHLPNGVYYLGIKTANGVQIEKVIKE